MKAYTLTVASPSVGYQHRSSRLFGHALPRVASRHAVAGPKGDGYTTVCGSWVVGWYMQHYDSPRTADHVRPASGAAGSDVTCRKCKRMVIARH